MVVIFDFPKFLEKLHANYNYIFSEASIFLPLRAYLIKEKNYESKSELLLQLTAVHSLRLSFSIIAPYLLEEIFI